jgi:glutamyl-tRNA reductase
MNRTLKKLPPLSQEEQDSLEAMTKSIITKILQDPIQCLKKNTSNGEYAEMVRELFRLKIEKPE